MSYIDVTVIFLSGLVVLILVYLAILTRQVALLHLRLQPTGARITDIGPRIGSQLDPLETTDIHGTRVQLVGDGRARLLLFVSPTCHVCQDLMPAVRAIAKSYRRGNASFDVALITKSEDDEANRQFVRTHGLSQLPYVMSAPLAESFQVSGSPYAVVVDADGFVTVKGIVNNVEHLESLLLPQPAIHHLYMRPVVGRMS